MSTQMIWHKAWLDTRWRFVIGLGVLGLATCGCVLAYPRALQVIAGVGGSSQAIDAIAGANPLLRDRVAETVQLSSTYRGFIWSQLYSQELPQLWCLFAIVLGSGGIISQAARGEGLFTLSLPVSRHRLVTVRASLALAELFILAMIPVVVLPLLSPTVQQSYSVTDALVHGLFLFGGGTVFFAVTFFLSSVFEQFWLPPLLMLVLAGVISFTRAVAPEVSRYTLAPILTARGYFFGTGLPWIGLVLALAFSAGLLMLAARNVARRDF